MTILGIFGELWSMTLICFKPNILDLVSFFIKFGLNI